MVTDCRIPQNVLLWLTHQNFRFLSGSSKSSFSQVTRFSLHRQDGRRVSLGEIRSNILGEKSKSKLVYCKYLPTPNIANYPALKAKLETITGIPPDSQILSLHLADGESKVPINPTDDKSTLLSAYNTHLRPYITLYVDDS